MSKNAGIINWTFQNETDAPSDGFELKLRADMNTANIIFTGTGGSTFTAHFEGKSIDNGAYYPVVAVNLATLDVENTNSTLDSQWQVDLTGYIAFRVRISAVAGDVTVRARVVS